MRPAVRLTRRPDGGFRLEGAGESALDAAPSPEGFTVSGGGTWRLAWNADERGWVLGSLPDAPAEELGRTTAAGIAPVVAPSSLLLADGRLFRLAMIGLADLHVEIGRWDVPGAYVVGRPESGSWVLERTAAGTALTAPTSLWILASVEIGRLDGWY